MRENLGENLRLLLTDFCLSFVERDFEKKKHTNDMTCENSEKEEEEEDTHLYPFKKNHPHRALGRRIRSRTVSPKACIVERQRDYYFARG